MKPGKMMALVAVAGLIASSATAAVRPAVSTQVAGTKVAPLGAGARVGASKARRSHIAEGAVLPLALAGTAAVGVGVAAAAGAFDSKHDTVSP